MRAMFVNLKTATKLGLVFSFIALIFMSLLSMTYQSFSRFQLEQENISRDNLAAIEAIYELRVNTTAQRADLLELTLANDANQEKVLAEINFRTEQNDKAIATLFELFKHDPIIREKIARLNQTRTDFVNTREREILPLISKKDFATAIPIITGAQAERSWKIRQDGIELSNEIKQQANANIERLQQELSSTMNTLMMVGALIFILTIISAVSLSRHIATPLARLTKDAEQLAQGKIVDIEHSEERKDEIGRLNSAFTLMSRYLTNLASSLDDLSKGNLGARLAIASDKDVAGLAFVKMLDNLRVLINDVREGIDVLASSSSDIVRATSSVATTTQETATSISEIATTVEEIKQSSKISAEHARNVTDGAIRTRKVADEGRAAVDTAVNGMIQIKDQMQAVAESVMKLGEQSQTISDIIATVNDIAEQSNLLGVNASIEAVKAGDAGKGFGVVAQEVKALAEQSKQATAQVRTILSDIQRAIGKTTMLVEQATKVVSTGVNQAQTSGLAIRALSEAIEQSSDMAMQVSASSQQQLIAMEQVVTAIENIRNASQDNVKGSKAVDVSVREIKELGQRLVGVLAPFKI